MRKVLFLMFLLLLMGLGAASVKAQVRIGGNGSPNAAAVLDLNATDGTNTGTKTLALPRVSLTSPTDLLGNTTLLTGMLVYNTNTSTLGGNGIGVYYWDGSIWKRVDDAIGNELTDTITGGGLTKTGSGTAADPWKVGIKNNSVTSAMIQNGTIQGADIANGTITVANTNFQHLAVTIPELGATAGSFLYVTVPSVCQNRNYWLNTDNGSTICFITSGTSFGVQRVYTAPSPGVDVWVTCWPPN